MKTRKLIAFALALTLTACSGCGSQREFSDDSMDMTDASGDIIIEEDGSISGDILYNSYRTEEIPDIMMEWQNLTAIGNTIFWQRFDDMTKNSFCCWYNAETGENGEFLPKCAEGKVASDDMGVAVMTMPDGGIGVWCSIINNLKEQSEIRRRCIEIYDENLNYVETIEIPEKIAEKQISYLKVDGQGNYYIIEWDSATQTETIECYDKDFSRYGEITYPTNLELDGLFQGGHGEVYAKLANQNYKNSESYYKVYRLDAEKRTCEEIGKPISPRGWWGTVFMPGTGEYDFYYSDSHGIYGVKDGVPTCALSYINSDIPVGGVAYYAPLANGDFFLNTLDDTFFSTQFTDGCLIAKQRTPEEFAEIELITLSTVGMYDTLENIVIDYNKQETGIRIILQDYANYNTAEDQTLAHAKLREDLLDGIVADIVCTDGLNFESLASKGLFGDWYDLMDADPEFNRSDYLENYFESMEYDGKLQKLGVSFHLMTGAAKTEHVGDQQGRTLTEFMQQPVSGGMEVFQFYNQQLAAEFWFTAAQNSFIDRKNAKCYFDTPEFVQLLETIKGYPTEEYGGIWEQTEIGEQPPVDETAFLENRALVKFTTFTEPIEYHALIRTVFRDTPITLVGYPTAEEDSNGGIFRSDFTISVNAQTEQKDAVWDFMKYLLSEKYQKKLNGPMPIHKGVLEEKLTLATKQVAARAYFNGTSVNIGEASQESMDTLSAYIGSIGTAYYYDATIEKILVEEMEMFLAGDQTAENAAKMMQSRVSIYLSEQS